MNVENIRKTRDLIAAKPKGYDQRRYAHKLVDPDYGPDAPSKCGTPACVAGHAVVACGGRLSVKRENWGTHLVTAYDEDGFPHAVEALAAKYLGVTENEADVMFASFPSGDEDIVTEPEHAIDMLNHLVATGRVEWRVTE